jgi:hypothetical protein
MLVERAPSASSGPLHPIDFLELESRDPIADHGGPSRRGYATLPRISKYRARVSRH